MHRRHRRVSLIAVTALAALSVPTGIAGPARAASPGLVITEAYGGGGNSGATLTQDFVELGNLGSTSATVDTLTVQYLSGSPTSSSTWQVTRLGGAVPAGARYLVAEAKGAGGTQELPTPDATGTTAMSATSGTVALVDGTTALTCTTAQTCAADPRIIDLVGYGSAVVRETSPATGASNTTSVTRVDGRPDTDDNSTDFAATEPSPTNLAGETPGGGTPGTPAKIHDIQGTTRVSPLRDEKVSDVTGVVTAVRGFGSARGFWFTDPDPDADPRTSEGLFVFTGSSTPSVSVGDAVSVAGTVKEFYPGDASAGTPYQSVTELTGAQVSVASTGNALPTATALTPGVVPNVLTARPGGSIEPLPLQPSRYSLDLWESHEGEVVSIEDARVVGPSTSFDELYVTTKPGQRPTPRGGTLYRAYTQPPSGVLKVESLIPFAQRPFPQANTGDRLTGTTSGPLDYDSFGGYTIEATTLGGLQDNGLVRETTRPQQAGELAVATYNVENLSPADPQSKFDELADGIVTHLASPDIVTLEEIQDDSGPTDDGVVTAGQTLQQFTDAVVAAGGPRYEWREIDPQDDTDGGQPGGNIRVAFLFNPQRVAFVDRPGGDATTAVQVVQGQDGHAALSVSPGRIEPTDAAWTSSRKPLAGEFVFEGRTVFVVANHFNSKGGDQPTHGRFQPPARPSEVQRKQQATLVRDFVDRVRAVEPAADVVVAGDLNDYQFSPALKILTSHGLVDLIKTLPGAEQYSYVFEGSSQVLDHILVTRKFTSVDYDVVHLNAEFADQASDHDPQVVRLVP